MVQILLDELVKGSRQREFISIVGEAGVGKTALVRETYSDVSVQGQFKYRAWVHASRHCKARELLQEILEHFRPMSTGERQGMTEEHLQKKLSECLEKNQYLIVVDDLRKIERWDMGVGTSSFTVSSLQESVLQSWKHPENRWQKNVRGHHSPFHF
ncbi:hypothetical protein F2P56_018268 [Juglans regia]|uniref:NB-ARC domain-containing protein n=1 Tax=Juglans regia TaxID=51240 RepID=A0A833U583_JUGRE|nr:hypothetical protein F2P56_018268 [Juglans regia]